jgi:hypothetical protein
VEALVSAALHARVVDCSPLPGGLGLRRFLRVRLDAPPHRAIARIESADDPAGRPAAVPAEPALEPLRTHLERAGLPVPRSFACDAAAGIDLLEDLGDVCLADAARASDAVTRAALYREATGLVPRLQAVAASGLPASERRLDAPLFAYKADLFARHSLPLALGREPRPAERDVVAEAFALVAEHAARAPARLAHRDFQSHNLMQHAGRLVMIDLQGAFLAPPEYDLVCLLRDSYVELAWSDVEALLDAIRPALPDAPEPDALWRRFHLLTLTRKAKDHARFADLAQRRGATRLLADLPATTRALHHAAEAVAAEDARLRRLADLVLALPVEPPA